MKTVKEKYIIAVDMDGTLLNSKGEITKRTAKTLQTLLDMGHYVTPASGRPRLLLPKAIQELQGISYAVLENGAIVWDWKQNKAIAKTALPKGMPSKIIEDVFAEEKKRGYENSISFEFFADGISYAQDGDIEMLKSKGVPQAFIDYMKYGHVFLKDLPSQTDLLDNCEKFNVFFLDLAFVKDFRERWSKNPDIYVTTSIALNAEFNAPGIDKGAGLSQLMEIASIPKERVIAIGDNENDVEMFDVAGHAVAMGNAEDSIKARANHVTLDNDHDGAAAFLEKFFGLDSTLC